MRGRPRRNWVACYLGRGLWGRLDEDDKLREPDQNLLILDFLLYFSVLIKSPDFWPRSLLSLAHSTPFQRFVSGIFKIIFFIANLQSNSV